MDFPLLRRRRSEPRNGLESDCVAIGPESLFLLVSSPDASLQQGWLLAAALCFPKTPASFSLVYSCSKIALRFIIFPDKQLSQRATTLPPPPPNPKTLLQTVGDVTLYPLTPAAHPAYTIPGDLCTRNSAHGGCLRSGGVRSRSRSRLGLKQEKEKIT